MTDEDISACEECGASVYKEHIVSGIARHMDGHLLCAHCVKEREGAGGDQDDDDLAPIEFDDDEDDDGSQVDMTSTRITSLADLASQKGKKDDSQYKRALDPNGTGASRCRVFHSRLSQGAIDFVTNQINEWLDEHDDITIKFATTTIGLFEGKHTEPNLITTVFY